jgi:hypothetical protein
MPTVAAKVLASLLIPVRSNPSFVSGITGIDESHPVPAATAPGPSAREPSRNR